jgi:hypothetical protein
MFDWMKRRDTHAPARPRPAEPPRDGDANTGEYHALYKYLRDRYANRLVLTFAEIEDLLGFRLPELARRQAPWWDGTSAAGLRSSQTNAWTLAGRRATVNLAAQTVIFERDG